METLTRLTAMHCCILYYVIRQSIQSSWLEQTDGSQATSDYRYSPTTVNICRRLYISKPQCYCSTECIWRVETQNKYDCRRYSGVNVGSSKYITYSSTYLSYLRKHRDAVLEWRSQHRPARAACTRITYAICFCRFNRHS